MNSYISEVLNDGTVVSFAAQLTAVTFFACIETKKANPVSDTEKEPQEDVFMEGHGIKETGA